MRKAQVAIIGSGNIGTDLLLKMLHTSSVLEPTIFVGIDPLSDGLKRARKLGIETTHEGIDGLGKHPKMKDIVMVFDSSSAAAHRTHDAFAKRHRIPIIDLTPAALGPYVIPVINAHKHLREANVSMVTCGGQATIPMVAAVGKVAKKVPYAEIVSSVASRSAGPGTRANIDEFTRTTARAIESIGGADRGKAIIILNPAEPPLIMRNSIFTLSQGASRKSIEKSVQDMITAVQKYVPGYRLKHELQFEPFGANHPLKIPGYGQFEGLKTSIFLEVEGAGHYLPNYAGNLDIMTSAALATGERIIEAQT